MGHQNPAAWQPPSNGKVKLNVDGIWHPTRNKMGGGGVLRDHVGRWISGFTSFRGQGAPFLAELLALDQGLQHTWNLGYRDVVCESDSLEVVTSVAAQEDVNTHLYKAEIMQVREKVQWK